MIKKTILFIITLIYLLPLNAQVVDERTGVLICFNVEDKTFPDYWVSELDAKGTSLDTTDISRSLIVINNALKKYPAELIRSNLKKIYILKSINISGQQYGGTFSSGVIYIKNNCYPDFFIEKVFHHEFSSILLRKYPRNFKKIRWRICNKTRYGKGGLNAIKSGKDSQAFDPVLNEKGCLHQYATSDLEEDFNSFAENLFNPHEIFYETVRNYPILTKKLELILQFYASIDKTFTREYFIEIINKNIRNKEQTPAKSN